MAPIYCHPIHKMHIRHESIAACKERVTPTVTVEPDDVAAEETAQYAMNHPFRQYSEIVRVAPWHVVKVRESARPSRDAVHEVRWHKHKVEVMDQNNLVR